MPDQDQRLDLAARAAWLYYVGNNTQDEIAAKLNVSRPGAQRLVALARDAGLIKVRIDHPIAVCMVLAGELRRRFGLDLCEVVPSDPDEQEEDLRYLAVGGAEQMERFVSQKSRIVIALGTGRTLRAVVEMLPTILRPQHRFVSLVGNVARDGSTNPFDAVMHLADKTGGVPFLLPATVVAESVEHRDQLLNQRLYRLITEVVEIAEVGFVGIGPIARDAPLHKDKFISNAELEELLRLGAVGEILGWTFDRDGQLIPSSINDRVTSLPFQRPPRIPMIAIAGGVAKAPAIRAALRGRWINGLVTDEAVARILLDQV